jgi:hypothetical protein
VLDQPAGLLEKMKQVLGIYNAMKAYHLEMKNDQANFDKWCTDNPIRWMIVQGVLELKASFDGINN